MTIEEQVELYDLFLSAIRSENLDYIEEKLRQIYNIMLDRINNMNITYIDMSTGKEMK